MRILSIVRAAIIVAAFVLLILFTTWACGQPNGTADWNYSGDDEIVYVLIDPYDDPYGDFVSYRSRPDFVVGYYAMPRYQARVYRQYVPAQQINVTNVHVVSYSPSTTLPAPANATVPPPKPRQPAYDPSAPSKGQPTAPVQLRQQVIPASTAIAPPQQRPTSAPAPTRAQAAPTSKPPAPAPTSVPPKPRK